MAVTRSRSRRLAPGRPPERQSEIVGTLRRQIVSGGFAPGSRLPNRSEMERDYGASSLTVQKALDQLVKDGFVCVRGRMGSYVSATPPHLNRIALLFNSHPGAHWGQFNMALYEEARRLNESGERQIAIYYDINGHDDSEDYQRLLRDIAAHRVAALIFATVPYALANSPLLDEKAPPSVTIGRPYGRAPGVAPVHESFTRRALEAVAAAGRSQVAIISSPRAVEKQTLPALLNANGLNMQPYWHFEIGLDWKPAARDVMHLMFRPGQDQRPDALIVGDDNLLAEATAGLVLAGVKVPEDVLVVAHCNFPYPAESAVPVLRLGFDTGELLRACLTTADAALRGAEIPPFQPLEARFETELASRALQPV